MTRRFKRHKDFEVALQILNDDFIRPPREAQRNWLLNRALGELKMDLEHLDEAARRFVAGSDEILRMDRTQAVLSDEEIMEDWQVPIMKAMAEAVTSSGGDILEIGFGRGVASDLIQSRGVRSHTVVECNDAIVARFRLWAAGYPDRDIRLIHGKWQDVVDRFGLYDGVFYHAYPLNESEYVEQVVNSVTFAEHFFPVASRHLRSGGVFTYLTNEADSLSRAHQRLLFRYFSSFSLQLVGPLSLPENSRDDLWADSMVVIQAFK